MSSSHPTPILDYAPPERPRFAAYVLSLNPLILGLLAYTLLCQPAIHRRGYPPIDPLWMGVIYLWPFPVLLFTQLHPAGRFSRTSLLCYALATAYVDAATAVTMVPHRFNWLESLILCVTFFAPIHLVITALLTRLARRTLHQLCIAPERSVPMPPTPRHARRRLVLIATLAFTVAFPFAYSYSYRQIEAYGACRAAEADWEDHAVILYSDDFDTCHEATPPGGIMVVCNFDPATGFPLRNNWHHGPEDAYNARVAELVRIHGIPSWSQKSRLIPNATLIALLNSSDLQPVNTIPGFLIPDVALMRSGSFTAWGTDFGSNIKDLSILTRRSRSPHLGQVPPGDDDTAFVGRLPQCPGVIFIRAGHHGVAACTDDGWVLGYAYKE